MGVQCSLLFFCLQQPFMYFIDVIISPPVYFNHSFLWIQQVVFSRLLTILAASLYIYFLTDFFFKYSVQTQTHIPKVWGEHDDKTVFHGTLFLYRQCHVCLGFLLWYSTYGFMVSLWSTILSPCFSAELLLDQSFLILYFEFDYFS